MTITQQWLKAWAGQYPTSEDAKLEPLRGREYFTKEEAGVVVGWKSPRTTSRFAKNSDGSVVEITRRAFSVEHELRAALILTTLRGVKIPVASALLMAQDPDRYTVADVFAWNSLVENGEFARLGPEILTEPWPRVWLTYLDTCRRIAKRSRVSLRDVDRALYTARGRTSSPEPEGFKNQVRQRIP